jgi:hypothetical protein
MISGEDCAIHINTYCNLALHIHRLQQEPKPQHQPILTQPRT